MGSLFCMAGLAEAQALMLAHGVLLLMFVTVMLAAIKRSRIAAVAALALAFLSGWCCTPWLGFEPVVSDDPDVHHFATSWRLFAWSWVAVEIVTVVIGVCVLLLPRKSNPAAEPQL